VLHCNITTNDQDVLMQYHTYELAHALISPFRIMARSSRAGLVSPLNPFANHPLTRTMTAGLEVFERMTRRYGKPSFDIDETSVNGVMVDVEDVSVVRKPFCELLHFKRDLSEAGPREDPKILLVAPMSGHYATLLRGTVEALIPNHEVYITDWVDARNVPVAMGKFDLDDYIDYLIDFIHFLGSDVHVIAVCQPAVPALAATAVMASRDDPLQPASLTLMGGPIDTRCSPTAVNNLAEEKPLSWFEQSVISTVPFPNPGFMRRVYPGFLQLTGFMTMNLERHTTAHMKLFEHLVEGDCDSVRQHKEFYNEYLAVMDLTAEFYIQTIATVFKDHSLPKGTMMHRDEKVDCTAIRKTALLTIEGERDDISGRGQTHAAHLLCTNIPEDIQFDYLQPGVGHYGIFNGTRWRTEIQPRIADMIRFVEQRRSGRSDRRHFKLAPEPVQSVLT
jgi:poly(3-hydroxybutyrate) depolymerase